jgi:single-strand DNA-binding protein
MANLNKVLLMGNLTHDPEMRYASGGPREGGGGGVCKLRLAVNRKWRNQAGEQQDETLYVDVAVFGRTGENCQEYLKKGRPVFVEGRLKLHEWQDRESGQKRSKIEVVAENVQFLGSRDGFGGGGGGGGGQPRDEAPRAPRDEMPSEGGGPPSRGPARPEPRQDEVNFDDIPF